MMEGTGALLCGDHDGFYYLDGLSKEELESIQQSAIDAAEDEIKEALACARRIGKLNM